MFAICSINVLKNKDLSSTDIRVYIAIQSFSNSDGFSFPSVSRLADICNISRRSVFRSLNNLVNTGVIEKQRRIRDDGGYSSNGYLVTNMSLGGDKNVTGDSDKNVTGDSDKNVTPNKNQFNHNVFLKNTQCARVGARENGQNDNEEVTVLTLDDINDVKSCFEVVKSKQYECVKLKGGAIGIRPRFKYAKNDVIESKIIEFLADKCGREVVSIDFGVFYQNEVKIDL